MSCARCSLCCTVTAIKGKQVLHRDTVQWKKGKLHEFYSSVRVCVFWFMHSNSFCDHSHIPIALTIALTRMLCTLCLNLKTYHHETKLPKYPIRFVCVYASSFQSFQSVFGSLVSIAVGIYFSNGVKLFCFWNFLSACCHFFASVSRPQGPFDYICLFCFVLCYLSEENKAKSALLSSKSDLTALTENRTQVLWLNVSAVLWSYLSNDNMLTKNI